MIFKKPKYWDKNIGLISIILYPLTVIVHILIFLKKISAKGKKFNIPIICVGNIYIGGTGKTPTSIFLANRLEKMGRKPVILRKYYDSHVDEHGLIKSKFKNIILDKDRINGINTSLKNNYDSVILDDGFQDYAIKKDLNIICFNRNQLIGNGMVLPSGPLREGLSSLRRADIIIINGDRSVEFENKVLKINKNLQFFYSNYVPLNINEFKNKKLLAIAGIGNPENFFQLIEKYNLKLEKKIVFPDHYKLSKNEMLKIMDDANKNNYKIIMTEKDFFKIEKYKIDNINYLKVSLEITNQEKLLQKINELFLKNN